LIEFKQDRETKNTIRFAEVVPEGGEPAADTVYFKKAWLEKNGLKGKETLVVEVKAKT